jgi:hypothetical protein
LLRLQFLSVLVLQTGAKDSVPTQDIVLFEHEVHGALELSFKRSLVMNKIHVLTGVACVSFLLTTGAFAEILGGQPGTSSNPKDNVPKEIQRSDPSGVPFGSGGSGPGTRSNALTGGMEKEKSDPVTRQALEQNAEQGGGAAIAAENLNEKSKNTSKKSVKNKHRKTAGASTTGNDGPKQNPKEFQQERSDKTVQGQGLVNEQPMVKQQPANR